MEKEKMISLARNLLFEPKEELFQFMSQEHEEIKKQLALLDKFDLTNIKPMTHINEELVSFDFLRDDIPSKALDKEKLLANAKIHDENFVIIRKVIND
ncbi:Asp-tRNA(Asn)/Glu-tRNA(Gln) amidotransferase subunit GatC [Mycoplasma zalophi]|uniref:Glutamyl-tRNA amidotransferase n=1 Tax=Mycoplasma zalophi TaxID=191287 RepID=A0ABS6DQ29_9MOLU|nr:Asp-tRNA(Asn)/Glu-tRNA(Gln) amidotransferase subunit GatC [Mycoplasma zalophi]MBU4690752.1 glutamyl-tRNA amidotransferase [Mycoplasma zalophi]MBU4692432.1 glutamyl-tRNA amidotransferase [Mycoplasma zalophi]